MGLPAARRLRDGEHLRGLTVGTRRHGARHHPRAPRTAPPQHHPRRRSPVAASPASRPEPDAIIVGAGLSGLVAAAELVDAGKRVVIVEQEPEASLGGQAHWSFGGLFLVDSPEQRRMGVKDSLELARQDWYGTAGFDRDEDEWGRALGRRLPRVRRRREARLAAREGRASSSPSSAGPSAAATTPSATATRCRASTSPGAPARACSRRSSRACRRASPRGSSSSATATASTSSSSRRRRRRRARRRPRAGCRGPRRAEQPRRRRRVRAARARRGRRVRRHRRQPRPRAASPGPSGWARRPSTCSRACPRTSTAACSASPSAPAPASSTATGCGTTSRASRTGTRSGRCTASASCPGRRRSGSTPTGRRLPVPLFPGFDTLGTLEHIVATGHDHSWFVLTQKIIEKEFALSGSEQNPDLTGKDLEAARQRLGSGATGPVEAFKQHGVDFVVADTLDELFDGMRALSPDVPSSTPRTSSARSWPATASSTTSSRRTCSSPPCAAPASTAATSSSGWRRRTSILDPKAGPLIAVKLHVLTRKSLGGIQTDLDSPRARRRRQRRCPASTRSARPPGSAAAACTATARSRAPSSADASSPAAGGRRRGDRPRASTRAAR